MEVNKTNKNTQREIEKNHEWISWLQSDIITSELNNQIQVEIKTLAPRNPTTTAQEKS